MDPNLTEALREAHAVAPAGVVRLDTIELRHPTFDQPVRVVRNHPDIQTWLDLDAENVQPVLDAMDDDAAARVGLVAALEATAPVDPGAYVAWIGLAFDLEQPKTDAGPAAEMTVTMDNVDRAISDALDAAIVSQDKVTVTYRPYLSIDISSPQHLRPMSFTLSDVEINQFQVTGRARVMNVGQRAFPNQLYTLQTNPGLRG